MSVKELATHRVTTLVSLGGSIPTSWQWSLCPIGHIVSGYEPRLLMVDDDVSDDGGLVRTGFLVQERGPHFFAEFATVKQHPTLTALLAYLSVKGANCLVEKRFMNSAGALEQVQVLQGKVVAIEDEDSTARHFAVELRSAVVERTLPRVVVKKGTTFLSDNNIPPESIGAAAPVPLGLFRRYLGPNFSAENAQWWRFRAPYFFRPNVIPAVEIYRTATESRFAFADYLPSGGLRLADPSDTAAVGGQALHVYIPSDDVYAWVRDNGSNVAFDLFSAPWNSAVYTAKIPVTPWVTIPFRPAKVLSTTGTSATNPERCIDGEPFTYAKIEGSGAIYLEVPQPAYRSGRISMNSREGGAGGAYAGGDGVDAPVGIAVAVCLVAPPGEGAPTAGSVKIEVVYPDTDDRLFSHADKTVSCPTTVGTANFDQLELPYRNQSDGSFGDGNDGWGGTKFHLYNFTCAPVSGDQDNPLFHAGSAGKTAPFRVKLSMNGATGKAFIADVRWCVGAKHNVDSWRPEWRWEKLYTTDENGNTTSVGAGVIDYYGDPKADVGAFYFYKEGKERGFGFMATRKRELPSLQQVYASSAGYGDAAGGTYTGTAGKPLANSADQARYLIAGYGKETSFVTAAGSHGSFTNARQLLDAWAVLAPGVTKWETDFLSLVETDVNSGFIDLSSQTPGLTLQRNRTGAWAAHVWYPDPTSLLLYSVYPGGVIDPRRCIRDGGQLGLQFQPGDEAEVLNDLEVEYGWDPGRGRMLYRAVCNGLESNDGQGNSWPLILGADPIGLCAWSQGTSTNRRFGTRKNRTPIRLHGTRDGRLAAILGCSLLARRYRPLPRLQMVTRPDYCDMEYGHVFTLNHNGMTALGYGAPAWAGETRWDNVWWRCTHSEGQGPNGGYIRVIRAEWLPRTIGGEIAGMSPVDDGGAM